MVSKVKEVYLSPGMQAVEFSSECIICESLNVMIWPLSLPSSIGTTEEFGRTDYGEANII